MRECVKVSTSWYRNLIQQQKDKLTVVWAVVIPVARMKKVLTNRYSNIGPLEGWKMRF